MSTTIADIGSAIVTALQAAHSGLDLSGTDRVKRGRYSQPPVAPPFACLSAAGVQSEGGPLLTHWTRTLTYDVLVWVPVTTIALEERVEAAEAAAHTLIAALDTARSSTSSVLYRCWTYTVRLGSLDADVDAHPHGAALVMLEIELSYATPSGLTAP